MDVSKSSPCFGIIDLGLNRQTVCFLKENPFAALRWILLLCTLSLGPTVAMVQMVGFRPPTVIRMIGTVPPWQLGHLHLHPPSVAPMYVKFQGLPHLRPVSGNWERSFMRSHGIWCSGNAMAVWSKNAGRIGGGTGSFQWDARSGGEFGRGRVGVRVGRVLNAGHGMDWVPVSVPLLDQYLMREMVPVFVLAVGICATLGMSLGALAGLVREVAVSGLPLRVACGAAMLQLPYFAAASMPMACLAASLFGLGRLQSDMESVALFAAGVPLWRMLLSPVCLCFVGVILKLTCHNCLIPYGSSQARKMVETALTTHMQGLRQTEDLIYQEYGTTEEIGEDCKTTPSRRNYGLQRIWYGSKLEGTRLAGLLLLEVLPSGYVHRVVVGDAAEWQMNESTWKFSNSTVLDVSPVGNSLRILQVDGFRVPSTPLTSGRALWKRTLDELPRNEIVGEINRLATRRRLEDKEPHANKTRNRVIDEDMLNKLEYFLYQRDAAAFSCVIYGLTGAIATLAQCGRGSKSVSRATPFAWAILASLIYNTVAATTVAVGSAKALNPWLSACLPPLLGLSILFVTLVRAELNLQDFRANKLKMHSNS
ncbi:hypothetical protein KC19_8G050300 [Ceratodon purpureus]|uniref:Uncharacterized protein n=1 Tax=Ceratodon purpureus TaxID=3225 RepID=A0A8T0GVH6_CERPU|nr:hypothetical protein KC19_8G050300 [Ceratodon purpureus]